MQINPFKPYGSTKKSGYELWKQEQDRRKQPDYVAPKTPVRAIQYEDPYYKGKSESDKSYQWEKDTLKELPIKKYGRSYNDKFKKWATEQGIKSYEMKEFRTFLDSKEDAAKTKSEGIDAILRALDARNQQSAERFRQRNEEASNKQAEEPKKVVSQPKPKKQVNQNDRNGVLGFVDRFVVPISKGATDFFVPGNTETMAANEEKRFGQVKNPVIKAAQKDRGLETDILNTVGMIGATVAPYAQGYRAADVAFNKIPRLARTTNPFAQRAIKGAAAGAATEAGIAATNELANPEAGDIGDYAVRTGLGVAGGAILDPVMYGAGRAINKGLETAAGRAMRSVIPSDQQTADAVSSVISRNDLVRPAEYTLPNGQKGQIKNRPGAVKPEAPVQEDIQPIGQNVPPVRNEPIQQAPTEQIKPRSTKIDDVVREHGFNDVTPETIAQSYNQKTWLHGTGTNELTADTLDPFVGNHEGLFGNGIYLTDEPEIAKGYAKSRSKRTGTPAVYEANVNVNRVLDAEKPPSPEAQKALLDSMGALDHAYEREIGDPQYFTNMMKNMIEKGKTTEEAIQKLRNEIKDFSYDAQISTSEFVEDFQNLAINLKMVGYDGITHTGGARTGNKPHRVLILLDPHDTYSGTGRAGQVTRFDPRVETQQAPDLETQIRQTAAATEQVLPEDIQAMRSEAIPLRQPTGDRQFKDMGFWESAVNRLKKATGSPKVYETPITRRELMNSMRKNLGVTIRTGRLGNVDENVQGFFKVDPEVIRTRQHGDVQVLSHEIGHHLDKQFSLTSSEAFDNELLKLGQATSGADYTPEQIRQEGLAEYVRLVLTDPEQALQQAPAFSQHFDQVLPKKMKNGLLKAQKDMDRWIEQGPELRLRGKIDRTGKEQVTIGERIDKIYSQFVDKFDRLKKVEKENTGELNSAEKSLYKKARLSVGAPKIAEQKLVELKSILAPIEQYGYSMKDVGDYAAAVHALELEQMGERVANEVMEEAATLSTKIKGMESTEDIARAIMDFENANGIKLTEDQFYALERGNDLELTEDQLFMIAESNRIESGMTLDEIQRVNAKYDTPEMQGIQQQIVAYNDSLVKMLQDGQVLTKEAVEAMKDKYPNYVPFFRFFDEDVASSLGGNKGFTNLTNPVKRLKGSTRDIIDPIESMIKNTFAVVNAVEKNKVGLELSRLADLEGAGQYIERLDGAQQVRNENIVTVFENGEKVQYQLDKDLYEAIQQLDEDRTNKVIQFLSYPAQMLRAGATLTPEFMLRNPIRDQFQAFVVSNYGYNPLIDLPRGAWDVILGKAFNKSEVYKKWAMNGGGYGNYLSQDRNYLRETLKTIKTEGRWYQKGFRTITNPKELFNLTIRTLQAFSELSEEATKVGEFKRALRKGASVEEAAFQSRDLMDFGRVGSDMRQWNRAVAFLNANIQGKDRIARAFKHNPVRTTTRALTGVTLPAVGAYLMMDLMGNENQKELYNNAPKWLKDSFFLIPIPGTDELARIPKPFDLAPIFANPVEQIFDYVKQNDPDTWSEFLKRQATEISSIPHMLTGLAPIIENWTNYKFFTGGPVVPRRDQDLLPEDQYGVNTSLTARTVGGALNYSPYKVDNFIQGYGAGLGRYATSGLDAGLQTVGAGKLPPAEAKKWSELPVVNAFTVDSTGGGQIMTDFYDALDRLTKERNSAKRNQEGYEQGDDVQYDRVEDYKYLNKISRNISEIRSDYREIQSSFDMSPEAKRRELDELDRQMNEMAREALIEIGEKQR
ncbi:hypothetical protein CVD25_01125 [Bacillus canaveralius]|uniref:Large polyvalent protein associated domain-containing protein n=1 Tax=Bacillus canaveralius TaxID=1403243 RepID=A0A2N5GPN0_9BACI|nr:LPD38 domain-containing protein [Bacillus canaveralius]PLR84666.1 hypothetical protein CU635_06235 [Bacillus canaveralius]PLS00818.1 hypothetical protein CVD25_01125 [Bacillus canaveralius]